MDQQQPVQQILIVGGGADAWYAAAYLDRRVGCPITVLEPADRPEPMIAEATLPTTAAFVYHIKLDEDEFMRRCHATYSLGTVFTDWVEDGHALWHAFGVCGGFIDELDLFHFWSKRVRTGGDAGPYSAYSLQALLAEKGRSPRPYEGTSTTMKRREYGYHVDLRDLAELMKQGATAGGVESCVDGLRDVVLDDRGRIERVETVGGRTLTADLYVDCTGTEARLLGQALGDAAVDWSGLFPADRSVTVRMPRDAEMHPRVRCTALEGGWQREISLCHRQDVGYFYDSAGEDDDAATRGLVGRLRGISVGEPHFEDTLSRRRGAFWIGNCLALGAAAASLEPVQPTRLLFLDKGLELLIKYFPDRTFSPSLTAAYNTRMSSFVDEARDFALLHYVLSRRDEPFWRAAREVTLPDALARLLSTYDETALVEPTRDGVFPPSSFYQLLSGASRLPRRPLPLAEYSDFDAASKILDEIRQKHDDMVEMLPAHRAMMEWLHGSDR